MRNHMTTLSRFFTIALAAVCLANATAVLASDCQPTKPATLRGPIAPNGPWIAYQCPEACGGPAKEGGGVFLRHTEDPYLLDWIHVGCPNGLEAAIPASSSCWNCINGCAGANCPPGELCVPIARSWGTDCRRYGCDDPAYMVVENTVTGVPYCRRTQPCPLDPPVQQCTPATVLLDGPTTIRTGASCTWSAEAFSECTGATYTYNWYVFNIWVGSGPYYTGGKPNGVLPGQSWRLRVEAAYNGIAAGSREIYVKEAANAPICMN